MIAKLTLTLLFSPPLVSAQGKADAEAQYERGEKLFTTYCARCHGKHGEGRMVKRLYRKLKTQLPSNFTSGLSTRHLCRPSGGIPAQDYYPWR